MSSTEAVRLQRKQICSHSSERLSAVITEEKRSLNAMLPFRRLNCTSEGGNEEELKPFLK
jgi:hypothetical protein